MKKRMICLASSLVVLMSWQASAQSLSIGDPAPSLTVSRYVKGEKVEKLDPEQTYVVEFWATWCGPCIQTIPHLTELQKKYQGKVKFIGVSVFEQDQSKVEPFVTKMGEKMEYSVALDDVAKGKKGGDGAMAKAWMEASESDGIPTAFIVQKGKVAWIGHPMQMTETLEKVVEGKFDVSAAAGKFREEKAAQKKMSGVIEKLQALGNDASPKERVGVLDAAIKETPSLEMTLGYPKYMMMLQGNVDGASAYGSHLVETTMADNAEGLNNIAWLHVAPEAKENGFKLDIKLALKAAIKACELSHNKNAAYLDTLAKAYFDNGDLTKAVENQEMAVKIGGQGADEMEDRLKEYRKAVDAKKKP